MYVCVFYLDVSDLKVLFDIDIVEATKIRITVVDSGKAASFVDLTHINAFRRGVIVIGNK